MIPFLVIGFILTLILSLVIMLYANNKFIKYGLVSVVGIILLLLLSTMWISLNEGILLWMILLLPLIVSISFLLAFKKKEEKKS